jgi:hypothetical protein
MKYGKPYLAAVVAGIGTIAAFAAVVRGETATLELKKLSPPNQVIGDSGLPAEYIYQSTYPQHFYSQIALGKNRAEFQNGKEWEADFKKIITKEPKYESENPFRGVVKFGSHSYGFALDSVPEKAKAKEEKKDADKTKSEADKPKDDSEKPSPLAKSIKYNRLYIDLNRNGDLTDDKVIEAAAMPGVVFPDNYSNFNFPQTDITIDADGTPLDYAFKINGYVSCNADAGFIAVQFNAAAYREGDITLDGKKHHVALIDFNSNGRFDDELTLSPDQNPEGRLGYMPSDMVLIDPDPKQPDSPYEPASSKYRNYVSKLVNIDGRYYDLKITPAGDKITLEASKAPLGNVTNKNDGYAAVIYGDRGFLKIAGDKNTPVAVPEGEWKLLSYSIKVTPPPEPAKSDGEGKTEGKEEKKPSSGILNLVPGAMVIRTSSVSAAATGAYKPVKVVKGETVEMPFGPPYKPVVSVYPMDEKQVHLGMHLMGSTGEECTSMTVEGTQPPKPTFTITDSAGKVVESGSFEYG